MPNWNNRKDNIYFMDGSIHVVRNRIVVAEGRVGELKRELYAIAPLSTKSEGIH
jgi:hypothetical protein